MKAPLSPSHAVFAARLRRLMERDGMTRIELAKRLDVTATMIGYWRVGRYLPSMPLLDVLVDLFDDPVIRQVVTAARTGRCPCGMTFDREQSRREYCSLACQRKAHLKGGRKADPKQEAIDAMCRGCEPERICRDDGCALRPFSPFLFVALHRRSA
jgi:transcriptional regulator with XRE-family HTH domain